MEPRDTSMPNDALDKTLNEGAASVAADSTNISTPIPEPAETVSSAVAVEEESPVAASSEELSEEVATERSHEPATKESILAALKLLSEKEPAEITNEEVSRLKQQFYAIRNEEQRNEREAFVEAGNQPEAFQPTTDETEEAFKAILATVKEKRPSSVLPSRPSSRRTTSARRKSSTRLLKWEAMSTMPTVSSSRCEISRMNSRK